LQPDLSLFDGNVSDRRTRLGIPWDDRDIAVCEEYVRQVAALCDSAGYSSRWLNAMAVYTDEERLQQIMTLPFVEKTIPMEATAHILEAFPDKPEAVKLARYQTERMGGKSFREKQITGKGVRIALIDAGFYGVQVYDGFKHIRDRGGIIKTYDFIQKKENVYHGSTHGTMVLSCIAGIHDTLRLGLAPDAEFLLARTEYLWGDTRNDEDRWIAALEWAEQNGADLVNSSLGYTSARHFPYQLDGTSMISRAANIAASKGVLVISSAGNEYNNSWRFITVPADADSVLTVGAINPATDYQTSFSSIGPTADGRIKPDVSAPGICAVINNPKLSISQGTSFSSPLVAGFAACVLQWKRKNVDAVQLKDMIVRSGHLFPYFDYSHGYGIPQADNILRPRMDERKFRLDEQDGRMTVVPYTNAVKDSNDYKLLYYHVQGRSGNIRLYRVVELDNNRPVDLHLLKESTGTGQEWRDNIEDDYTFYRGEILRVFFEGHYEEYLFK